MTALAGAGLRVRPVSPNRALAATAATAAGLIERCFVGFIADALFLLAELKGGSASRAAEHSVSAKASLRLT